VTLAYVAASAGLFLYGANWYYFVWKWRRNRARPPPEARVLTSSPMVTVQIPVYDERYVAQRLLETIARFDWPKDRLEIQVLDDSDDDTSEIIAKTASGLRARGIDVHHLRRGTRAGFKAGALSYGLERAKGDFIAVFDCDFLPPPDFLTRSMPEFEDPKVGLVQARWGHLNRDYSRLTRAQALGIDGHFAVEQEVRYRAGFLLNFNGTAGVFRRTCIEDAGGWTGDTLAEDLDLSYRAQLRGWRFVYRKDIACPAELPAQIQAFKRQQFRWAKGSIQVWKKLSGSVRRSGLTRAQKLQAQLHLSLYMVHPLMLLSFLLLPPVLLLGRVNPLIPAIFATASLGPASIYVVAQRDLASKKWRSRLLHLPYLTLLGVGQCLNNTIAVVEALIGRETPFLRTPKFGIEGSAGDWRGSRYALHLNGVTIGEWLLVAYGLVSAFLLLQTANWWFLFWVALYTTSFGLVAGLSLLHSRATVRPRRRGVEDAETA
jgi:cellulose synthase/poly-beta-1,6-N-acetylglucosamine synthase-like glycosyltransferase